MKTTKKYSEEDMIEAARYGYNFHKTTQFPNQEFDDSCIRNTQQWLKTIKNKELEQDKKVLLKKNKNV